MMQAASPLASRRRNRSTLNPWAKAVSVLDRKSTRLNSSHSQISYAVFCLKKKKKRHELCSQRHSLRDLATLGGAVQLSEERVGGHGIRGVGQWAARRRWRRLAARGVLCAS